MSGIFGPRLANHLRWRMSQLGDVPRVLFRRYGSRVWNDVILARSRRLTPGAQTLGDRIAIYVVFAPEGLRPSHLSALASIAEAGYASVVVSNGSLSEGDRARILEQSATLLERVNFGYDFGAYRDGIRLVKGRLAGLSRLVLANDSVWFPLPGKPNWLTTAEAIDADVVGASSNLGVVAVPRDRWTEQTWTYDPTLPRYHLCSFLLSFRPRVLQSAAFCDFWARFPLSNNKFWVVTRGEVGLSRVLREAGFSFATTTELRGLAEVVSRMPEARLRQLLERLIIPEDASLRAERDAVLAAFSPATRTLMERFVLYAIAETGPAYALADLAILDQNQTFLKKSPLWREPDGASASLAILREVGAAEVLAEAELLASKLGR